MIFEGHFTLSRPISRKLYRIRPQKLKLLIRNPTFAFRWYECPWPWRHFKVIKLFHIKFLVSGALYGKSYYRILIGNHTLAFDWCHFWWPWSTFEGHFSLGCHFHVHFSNLRPAFASCGLPAIAELLVLDDDATGWSVSTIDWSNCARSSIRFICCSLLSTYNIYA